MINLPLKLIVNLGAPAGVEVLLLNYQPGVAADAGAPTEPADETCYVEVPLYRDVTSYWAACAVYLLLGISKLFEFAYPSLLLLGKAADP